MTYTDKLTSDRLRALAEIERDVCLTITMPAEIAGDQQRQNRIRFENCIEKAREKLLKIGMKQREIDVFLLPLTDKLNEKPYWGKQNKGLIALLTRDISEFYRLPIQFHTSVIVDRHFYLRPVIPYVQSNISVAALLLNERNPRLLFANDKGCLKKRFPPEKISGLDEFLEPYEFEKSLQFESGNVQPHAPNYHAQGDAGDRLQEKRYAKEYLKEIEEWVSDKLDERGFDRVYLVAEPEIAGMYMEVVQKNGQKIIKLAPKNPDSEEDDEWVNKALNEVRNSTVFEEKQKVGERYEHLKNSRPGAISDEIEDIVASAYNGRVGTLMIPANSDDHLWGRFDPESQNLYLQEYDESVSGPGDELVNMAAIKTFLAGGRVIDVPANEGLPLAAAIYRW
jgi:hypothetical protein